MRVHEPAVLLHETTSRTGRRGGIARAGGAASFLLVAALVGGCGREREADDARALGAAARAGGVWDAEFRLARTPKGPAPKGAPVARGTIALVATRRDVGREWLQRPTTHTGVHDLDFHPLGFVPEATGPVPTLVAAVAEPDTLLLATPAGSGGGMLAMRGVASADGAEVAGTWTYATRAAGGWGGTFTLRRPPA